MGKVALFLTLCGRELSKIEAEINRGRSLGIHNFEIRKDLLGFPIVIENRINSEFVSLINLLMDEKMDGKLILTLDKVKNGIDLDLFLKELEIILAFFRKYKISAIFDLDFKMGIITRKKAESIIKENDQAFILSYHDYDKVIERSILTEIFKSMCDEKPDCIKFAFFINFKSEMEELKFIKTIRDKLNKKQKITVIGMGELGKVSRIRPSEFDSYLSYTSFNTSAGPGQLEPEEYIAKLKYNSEI